LVCAQMQGSETGPADRPFPLGGKRRSGARVAGSATPASSPDGCGSASSDIARVGHGRKSPRRSEAAKMKDRLSIGIDVSKDKLDVAMGSDGEVSQVTNDESGHADLLRKLESVKPALVILEASGGYEAVVA